jgi:uncharacterized protein YbdZ (MbtH family)
MSINIQRNQWLKTTIVLYSFLLGSSFSAAAVNSLVLSPTTLPDFAAGKSQSTTLSNPSAVEVKINSISITGTNKGEFTFTTVPDKNCGGKVAAGTGCKITITFTPDLKAAGDRTATLEVKADTTYTVDLTGTAGAGTTPSTDAAGPTVDLKPNPVDFGKQPVKTTSKEKIVTLTNTGKADLTFKKVSFQITGSNSGDFKVTTDPADISVAPPIYNCGGTLKPKAKCQIKLTFTPTAAGDKKATLEVTSNAKSSPDKVNLTGTGTETAVTATLTPTAVDFKTQVVKTPSAAKSVTLKNTGKTDLTKLSISLTGDKDFAATNDCGTTLAAGKTCKINIILTPKTAGDKKATVEAKSDKTSLGKVDLTGTGTEATTPSVATWTPATVDFKNQAVNKPSAVKSVTLKNISKTDLTKLSISLTGDKDFVMTNDCGTTLAAGKTCQAKITFTPKTTGDKKATLEAKSDKTSLDKVDLTGIGGDSPTTGGTEKVTANPTPFDSGNVIVNTSANKTVTLTNEGKSDVKDFQITLDATGEFTTTSTSTCGSTLAAGKNCTVEITFKPTKVGKQAATLNVASGKTSLVKVPVMGMGVEYPSQKAIAIDLTTGNPVETTIQINGGVSLVDPVDFKSSITVKKNQPVVINAMISSIPEQDIGKQIDVIAIGYFVREPFLKVDGPSADNCDPSLVTNVEQGGYYIVKNDNSQNYCDWIVDGGAEGGWCVDHKPQTRDKEQATKHYVEKWDKNLNTLEPLYSVTPDTSSLILSEQNNLVMYQGTIDGTGHVCVYLGYRTLAEGEGTPVFLNFNEDPLMIRVTD